MSVSLSGFFMKKINDLMSAKGYLLADGATGTNLFLMGLESGHSPEFWNIEHPDRVLMNHRGFIEAGSDIILTNTFGANQYRLGLHKAENMVSKLNYEAAQIAYSATSGCGREIVIAGSIGPTGEIMKPLGPLEKDSAISAFSEQAIALRDGGVDLIWIETMSSQLEMQCAIIAAIPTQLPIFCSYSFDTHGKSMMGHEPKELVALVENYPEVHGYGANCGIGMSELIGSIICFSQARNDQSRHIIAKANCGIPEFIDGEIEYNGSPEMMAKYACYAKDIGATIIGGCCGTKKEHVEAMRTALKSHQPKNRKDLNEIVESLGEMTEGNISLVKQYLDQNYVPKSKVNRKRRRRK